LILFVVAVSIAGAQCQTFCALTPCAPKPVDHCHPAKAPSAPKPCLQDEAPADLNAQNATSVSFEPAAVVVFSGEFFAVDLALRLSGPVFADSGPPPPPARISVLRI
jgi:hypothetical protein